MGAVIAFPVTTAEIPADPLRCTCTRCAFLDRRHPDEGWQLRLPLPGGAELHTFPTPTENVA